MGITEKYCLEFKKKLYIFAIFLRKYLYESLNAKTQKIAKKYKYVNKPKIHWNESRKIKIL